MARCAPQMPVRACCHSRAASVAQTRASYPIQRPGLFNHSRADPPQGRAPIARAVIRSARPITPTSPAASTAAITSAAQICTVWP